MDSLYQRLKELDPDTFQRFSFQLLKEQHPGLELKHVDGKSGDEGLDVFAGELYGKPAIWQCKSFPNGVGKSQKEQIRKSLRTALKHFSPCYWILCLSVDLNVQTFRWFEKLKKSYESKVKIGQMLASDFVNEILHRRSLRNHFFPNASLDVAELKRMATRTGEMTLDELEKVTGANLEDIIERWKDRDARFNYQIVFDGDLGPPPLPHGPVPAGLVMSMWKDGKTINVFARDVASLRANPPQFTTTIKGTGLKKLDEFVRTGATREFEIDEIGPISSDWPVMSDIANVTSAFKLRVGPSPLLTNRKRNVRLEFVSTGGTETIRYELMELRPVRAGTDELEFSLSGNNVPFSISVVLSILLGTSGFTFHLDAAQRNPKIIKKALDALNLLRPSGQVRLFDLETEKYFLDSISSVPDETLQDARRRALINDVAAIADRFGVDLNLPDKITEGDFETIFLLKQYMENGTIKLDDITFVVTKSEENRDLLPQQFALGRFFFRFTNMRHEPLPVLFGTPVDTGPVVVETEAEIKDLSITLRAFTEAAIGSGVRMSVRPLAPVRVSVLSGEAEDVDPKPRP